MAVPTTLVTIVDELQLFCNSHKEIERFEFEFEEQLPNLSTEEKSFPFVFATPISMSKSGNMVTHTLRIYAYDRIDRDRTNVLDITNDNSLLLIDIYKYWNDANKFSNIEIINEPNALPTTNETLDYLQGWYADFQFELPTFSRCDIPVPNGVPGVINQTPQIVPYLTCQSLADCNTFTIAIDNLQNQIDNIPADTNTYTIQSSLNGTLLSFDRNDLVNAYSVDLAPLLTNYLTCSDLADCHIIIDIRSDISGLDTRVGTLESDYTTLESRVTTNEGDILTNQNNISSNDTDISNLQSDLNTLDSNAFQEATLNGNIIEFYTNAITVDDSVDLSPVLANYLPLTGGTITGNLTVDSKVNKAVYAENPTGTIISFTEPEIYNSATTPGTGNITDDLTNAKIGVVQKIYHNDTTAPTFPAGWVLMGTSTYTTGVLNVIYAEWSEGTRVEYWIVQEN